MLKLKYDVKCGWNQLYIVEKDIETDISFLVGKGDDGCVNYAKTEKKFYEKYKDRHDSKLIYEFGLEDIIYDKEYYTETFFLEVYKNIKSLPTIFKVLNINIIWNGFEDGKRADALYSAVSCEDLKRLNTLRAGEVMDMLNISRNTLCSYVKKGLIKIDPNYKGKQYRYLADSVVALRDKKKR